MISGRKSDGGLALFQPLQEQSPCAGCLSGCCRAFVVPLTGHDIVRIMADRKLSFWDFGCRYADPSGDISRGQAPHFHFDDEPETPFVVGLLQDQSTLFAGARKCRFLQETANDAAHPGGATSCTIYENRPMACRVFPTRLNERNAVAAMAVPEYGRAGRDPAYRLCSRPWTLDDLDVAEARRNLQRVTEEMQQMHLLADRWNRSPRSWSVFPELIQMVFGDVRQTA